MNVKCIAHTALSDAFKTSIGVNDRAAVSLTAIRTCYSANKPTQILPLEGAKYFGRDASDGGDGTDADRLFRHIVHSGHTSTLEHIVYTFAVDGVSRSLLAQLTRHRQFSFSVQSQRYVKFGSDDKSGGFDYVTPQSVTDAEGTLPYAIGRKLSAEDVYSDVMDAIQTAYDDLRSLGVPSEDARMVLPNAATTNLVMTGNLRAILEFYGKRQRSRGAQSEICELAQHIRTEVTTIDAWTTQFFETV